MFFVKDEVLVKFRVQNLEGIKMHGTFIEFKRKKKENIPSEVNWKSNNPLNLTLKTRLYTNASFKKMHFRMFLVM